jgi:hypothetical protein
LKKIKNSFDEDLKLFKKCLILQTFFSLLLFTGDFIYRGINRIPLSFDNEVGLVVVVVFPFFMYGLVLVVSLFQMLDSILRKE